MRPTPTPTHHVDDNSVPLGLCCLIYMLIAVLINYWIIASVNKDIDELKQEFIREEALIHVEYEGKKEAQKLLREKTMDLLMPRMEYGLQVTSLASYKLAHYVSDILAPISGNDEWNRLEEYADIYLTILKNKYAYMMMIHDFSPMSISYLAGPENRAEVEEVFLAKNLQQTYFLEPGFQRRLLGIKLIDRIVKATRHPHFYGSWLIAGVMCLQTIIDVIRSHGQNDQETVITYDESFWMRLKRMGILLCYCIASLIVIVFQASKSLLGVTIKYIRLSYAACSYLKDVTQSVCLSTNLGMMWRTWRNTQAWFEAAEQGQIDTIKSLLESETIDVNLQRQTDGETCLTIACRNGRLDIVKMLLVYSKMKCDVNLSTQNGECALTISAGCGNIKIVNRILECNELNLHNGIGEKSIRRALHKDYYEVALLIYKNLLKSGVKLNNSNLKYLQKAASLHRKLNERPRRKSQQNKIHKMRELKEYKTLLLESQCQNTLVNEQELNLSTLQDLLSLVECDICYNSMLDKKIFACQSDHWVCQDCVSKTKCFICQEDLEQSPPRRCYTVEKLVTLINGLSNLLTTEDSIGS